MYYILSGNRTFVLVCIAILFIFSSCEKEVHINLKQSDPQLVVEGAIETNQPPYVILTNSLSYFDKIDLATLQNNFIHDAEVYVSDGSKQVRLIEYTLDSGFNTKFYAYSIGLDSPMIGEVGKTYKLTIKYNGQTYEGTTKIPYPTPLDSVLSVPPAIVNEQRPDRRQLKIFFKDPDTLGNCIRYFTKRNREPFYPGPNSVYNDELINGTYFQTYLAVAEAPDNQKGFDSSYYAYPGDTVILKWCATDRSVYEFYNTFEYAIGSLGNPFASPTRVSSNINNKAIGIWAGYGAIYDTVYIK